jgi:hypothetical protein
MGERILEGTKKFNSVSKGIIDLGVEEYFNLSHNPSGEIMIKISPKGISAFTGSYFLVKNDEIVYKRVADFSLVVLNIAIATTAIIALII